MKSVKILLSLATAFIITSVTGCSKKDIQDLNPYYALKQGDILECRGQMIQYMPVPFEELPEWIHREYPNGHHINWVLAAELEGEKVYVVTLGEISSYPSFACKEDGTRVDYSEVWEKGKNWKLLFVQNN